MSPDALPKPYLNAWLKRTRKELSASGRLSELVLILSGGGGSEAKEWRARLQRILDGEEDPCFEILTRIDSILSKPARCNPPGDQGAGLFD